ncbi:tetratricopeptide repeat protein [Sulfuricaulis sp.]|uniref:tetratricopeptide repeat protein n=1 Tax=Sulfuricaulis sp. TaxID=2003553 RepID=UPI0035598FB2
MRGNFVIIFFLMLVVLTAGCGSNPPALTEQQETAIQFNQRGETAFRRGDYAQALQEYQGALSIHRSVENVAGIATELLNLSVVYRWLGDKAAAQATLDRILTERSPAFSADQKAEAAYRKAGYYLDDGNETEALSWLNKALEFCHGCGTEGRLYNLMARMALAGQPQDAMNHARRALVLNRNAGDKNEAANSQRLIADAAFKLEDFKTAQQSYDDALRLDKDTGAAAKIALDLMGLGRSIARQGRRTEAVEYFQRAYSVSEGAGDTKAMEDAAAEIKKVTP